MKKYRALVGLTFPATAKDLELKRRGQPCRFLRVEADEITENIPESSLPWLLRDGLIEEVKDDPIRKR